jgi:SAM-dependent methyltransferase
MTPPKRTSEFFDAYAADFNAIYGTSNSLLNRLINRHFRKSMMLRYARTIEGCRPMGGRQVIDIGCGPGHYGITLAKQGAGHVLGIDFAPGMVDLARRNAAREGVEGVCEFVCDDFMTHPLPRAFDYSIVMGFMDYVDDPRSVIARVLSVTASRAFFSFPAEGGFLAWQRRLRYRRRCDLYLYGRPRLEELFRLAEPAAVEIERIERDFFVTVSKLPPGPATP